MTVSLIPIPDMSGNEFVVRGTHCLVGRGHDCDLKLAHGTASRHHAELISDDLTLRLRDLASTNGTYVNGERINGDFVLHDGDVVAFGMPSFRVHCQKQLRKPR